MSPFLFSTRTLATKSPTEILFSHFFSGLLGVVYTRSAFVHDFHNRVPQGGFFFAGSLVYDIIEDETSDSTTGNLAAEIAQNMNEVAEIEKAEKAEARARAAKADLVKQAGLAQRILREQSNTLAAKAGKVKNMIDMPKSVPKELDEEFLRTKYYKDFHKGYYHSKYFDAANKK